MLSLTPLFVACGIVYSALPVTFTRMGSPPPPDFRFRRIPAPPIGAPTEADKPFFPECGEATLLFMSLLVSAPGEKNEVLRGVAKFAA